MAAEHYYIQLGAVQNKDDVQEVVKKLTHIHFLLNLYKKLNVKNENSLNRQTMHL